MTRHSSPKATLAAAALVAGPFEEPHVRAALARIYGRESPLVRRLAARLLESLGATRRPRACEVAAFLDARRSFHRAVSVAGRGLWDLPAPVMWPAVGAPRGWQLPALTTRAELAEWLALTPAELAAFTREWRPDAPERDARLGHYRYAAIPRRGRTPRLIEAPKARLKAVQRRILTGILAHIPAHAAAHGFVAGRDTVSYVNPHVARHCVLRMDVADFFASLRCPRIVRVFLTAGYPEPVAQALASLCTTVTPASVRARLFGSPTHPDDHALLARLAARHLPQGAPSSPALSNLCCWALDARLTGLARRFGATYSRYADDLLFSGAAGFARDAERCAVRVAAILLAEGLSAAHRKTKVMRRGGSQRAAGLVLNERPAVPRRDRELLEAILTNCRRFGPAGQNRAGHSDFRAHLRGRIASLARADPRRGRELLELFAAIDWA